MSVRLAESILALFGGLFESSGFRYTWGGYANPFAQAERRDQRHRLVKQPSISSTCLLSSTVIHTSLTNTAYLQVVCSNLDAKPHNHTAKIIQYHPSCIVHTPCANRAPLLPPRSRILLHQLHQPNPEDSLAKPALVSAPFSEAQVAIHGSCSRFLLSLNKAIPVLPIFS